jgi:hypothetical protein
MSINRALTNRKSGNNGFAVASSSPAPLEEYQHQLSITRPEKEIIDLIRTFPGLT